MRKIKNVNIIGMGALGLLYGNMIAEGAGQECVNFVMDDEHYEKTQGKTFTINGKEKKFNIIRAREAKPADLIILAVKFTGIDAALDVMESSVGENSLIISVLNGILSEEILAKRFGEDKVLYAVAEGMDAMRFGTKLSFTKPGTLFIGTPKAEMQHKLDILSAFFEKAGVGYNVQKDILHKMWSKFMLNVGINQTCMIYAKGYGEAMKEGSAEYMTLVGAMREVKEIANIKGIALTEEDIKRYLKMLKTLDPLATPSMGQDRINKKPSEVELFAGTVLRLAKECDVLAPANQFIYEKVREIESEY